MTLTKTSNPGADQAMSLAEFLAWPRIDEKPYLEYIDGRIEAKVSPQGRHNVLGKRITRALDDFAEPGALGQALPEQQCTFGGRSILPDVILLVDAKIQTDERGVFRDEVLVPPDIHVEIRSPGQSMGRTIEKIEHSLRHGCPLGWYFDPDQETVRVYRPGRAVEILKADGVLEGEPALPGFRLAISEVFGWLVYRRPKADPS